MIEKFIQENLERDVNSFLQESDLYKRYLLFCKVYEIEPLTNTQLGNRLNYHNAGVRHKRTRKLVREKGRQGVRLSPCKY